MHFYLFSYHFFSLSKYLALLLSFFFFLDTLLSVLSLAVYFALLLLLKLVANLLLISVWERSAFTPSLLSILPSLIAGSKIPLTVALISEVLVHRAFEFWSQSDHFFDSQNCIKIEALQCWKEKIIIVKKKRIISYVLFFSSGAASKDLLCHVISLSYWSAFSHHAHAVH